jgi:hypothetical protein
MAGDGDSYERCFRAGGPAGPGGGPVTGEPARPARPPQRRSVPSPAQQRLMARIKASRKARQRRAFLIASGLVSALVLFVSGAGWALTGYVNHRPTACSARSATISPVLRPLPAPARSHGGGGHAGPRSRPRSSGWAPAGARTAAQAACH